MIRVLLTCMFFLAGAASYGQVQSTVDRVEMLIGDRNMLHIEEASGEGALDIEQYSSALHASGIEVIDPGAVIIMENQPGWRRSIVFTSFDSGVVWIPPAPVVMPSGDTLYSNEIPLELSYPALSDSLELAPIKEIMEEPWTLEDATVLYIVLGLLLLSVFLSYRALKRYSPREIELDETEISPYQRFYVEMKSLWKRAVWQKGEVKQYYSDISLIFRRYLEDELHIPALESTTTEIRTKLSEGNYGLQVTERIVDVLQVCDGVKYANMEPRAAKHPEIWYEAHDIVRSLKSEEDNESNVKHLE